MLNRAELLQELDRSWSRFIAEVEKLTDDQLMAVGVTSKWSMRDLLAHMLFWHERLERRAAGSPAPWEQRADESREAYINRLNAEAVEKMKNRSGRHLVEELKRSHARIVTIARTASDAKLADAELQESFRGDGYGHYDEHFEKVRAFAARQAGAARGA